MNCESAKDLLVLLGYGELSFEEEEALLHHLEACRACAAERRRLEMLDAMLEMQRSVPGAGLLARCREDLSANVAREAGRGRGLLSAAWWRGLMGAAWLKPAGAVALLAVGFVGGHAVRNGAMTASVLSPRQETPAVNKVHEVDSTPDGKVRVSFDETRQREVHGDLNDPRVRGVLLAAVSDQDPALRIDSIDLLRSHCDDDTVRKALLKALRSDRYSGVRLRALEALRPYARDPETRTALSDVLLNDPSPAMRTQAIDLLVQSRGADVAGTLQEVLRHEELGYIRERSVSALRAMKASAGTF